MNTCDFFCFGDGFASGNIWPEWPDILQALYPEQKVKNFGAIGAGNEFIVNSIVHAFKENPDGFFLIQWAQHNRFDKLLQDPFWNDLVNKDQIYHFNKVDISDQTWWLSSNSNLLEIRKYHDFYIQEKQSINRTKNYIYLAYQLLNKNSVFFSSYPMIPELLDDDLVFLPDMDTYSRQEKFNKIRQSETQPSPPVHFEYLKQHILPKLPVQPDLNLVASLGEKIHKFHWVPYHPDRVFLWKQLSTCSINI